MSFTTFFADEELATDEDDVLFELLEFELLDFALEELEVSLLSCIEELDSSSSVFASAAGIASAGRQKKRKRGDANERKRTFYVEMTHLHPIFYVSIYITVA